ncbi:hypothetical protein F4780DRAFT_796707 [Xylariomycetidae sp. FL0641]|nr:hypothetical protein F4780DRAFT_796707 [Xylariomycetidae sp. FL0641]
MKDSYNQALWDTLDSHPASRPHLHTYTAFTSCIVYQTHRLLESCYSLALHNCNNLSPRLIAITPHYKFSPQLLVIDALPDSPPNPTTPLPPPPPPPTHNHNGTLVAPKPDGRHPAREPPARASPDDGAGLRRPPPPVPRERGGGGGGGRGAGGVAGAAVPVRGADGGGVPVHRGHGHAAPGGGRAGERLLGARARGRRAHRLPLRLPGLRLRHPQSYPGRFLR